MTNDQIPMSNQISTCERLDIGIWSLVIPLVVSFVPLR